MRAIAQPSHMFYKAFYEYKNEGVFIKLMEEIQSMECSYFKSECYSIPTCCEQINQTRFREMLKKVKFMYSEENDYTLANKIINAAFGSEKKYRYYKDTPDKVINYIYAKSIDFIFNDLHTVVSNEICYGEIYVAKMNAIVSAVNSYLNTIIIDYPTDMQDVDFTRDMFIKPEFKEQMSLKFDKIENMENAPLTNEETIAICNYKLIELNFQDDGRYKGIFNYDKFKSRKNLFNDFKEIINLLSYDYYCDWVKKIIESDGIEKAKIDNIFSKLPTDEIWNCVITDAMINSYIDICMWNNNEMFKCSFEYLFKKFDEEYIHYTSTATDKDIPLVKELINDRVDTNSNVKAVIRIRNIFKEIDENGYVSNFFNHIPHNSKNKKSTEIPEFSMAMIFSLLMYKYSFGRKKSTASEVSYCKLYECINCYMKLVSRNTFMQDIDKRDLYKAQCFLEKYLLNLIYNVNGIIRYSVCKFESDELRKSYRSKLVRNKYILTYQKLWLLQSNNDISITYFIAEKITKKYIEILTYILTSIKASSIEAYQNVINSFKLYLINDNQSPIYLIEDIVPVENEPCDLSADDYAEIFGFNYYNTSQKSNKKKIKGSPHANK